MKQLDSEGHARASVHGDDQGEGLFDKDIVAIYISSSHEISFDDDTITLKSWVQELGGGRCVVGFLLLKQGTAATRAVSIVAVIVMVVSIAPAQDSCE
jgi:acyl-CoA thioesterase FadM